MKMKIGLIGFGKWVRSAYIPALQYDGRAEVTAVTAATEQTRQLAREILGPSVVIYQDYKELLEQARIDAVMVAVPDNVHQQVLESALKADPAIAVFYEPPISHRRDQIPVMIDRLLRAGRVTFAHLELGFHPSIVRARELIEDHTIGLLQKVTISLQAGWGCKGDEDLCLMDRMSPWYVEVLNRIMDSVPERVLVLDGYGKAGRMQTVSTAVYDYHGIWGIFKADIGRADGVSIEFEITGNEGTIYIDYFTGQMRFQTIHSSQTAIEDQAPLRPYADYPGVREAVSAFLNAASSKDPGAGNAKEAAQLNLIGLATEESKDTGTWAAVARAEIKSELKSEDAGI